MSEATYCRNCRQPVERYGIDYRGRPIWTHTGGWGGRPCELVAEPEAVVLDQGAGQ